MKKIISAALAIALVAPVTSLAARKKETVSSLQLQQMQSREFEATKNMAFAATMTVLQDAGYRIGSADRDTGLITGIASTKTNTTWLPFIGFGKSKKTPVVSAYIEDRGPSVARVRLSFVMTKLKGDQFGGSADEEPIVDPTVYQGAFERISKELFVRAALEQPKVEGSPAAPVQEK